MKRAAALVELGGSHDECLYSQAAFLADGGYEVHLVVSPALQKRVTGWDCVEALHVLAPDSGEIGAFKTAWKLRALLNDIAADLVVFNTAHGAMVRFFSLLPQGSRRLAGVVHNILKLRASRGQRLISRRMKRYLVLNDYLLENRSDRMDVAVDWFYPIFFPAFEPVDVGKQPEAFWVGIPGKVDFLRRDYRGLLKGMAERELPTNLRLLILGGFENDAVREEVQDLVAATGQPDRFQFFQGFIDNPTYQSYLAASDLILPLLHPGTERFHEYSEVQISGAYNLAFSHRVPLLMENFFSKYRAFAENSLFYTRDGLAASLAELADDPSPVAPLRNNMARDERYTFAFQRDRYLNLVDV